MKLIAEKRSRTDKYDLLRCIRDDGSSTEAQMPRQGILPHDLLHYVVESALPLRHGFLSLLARGAEAAFVMEQVHDKRNAGVETEAVQVEAIVEGLQAQLWSGALDQQALLDGAASACEARGKPPYDFRALAPALHQQALALSAAWAAVPYYGAMTLTFNPK